MDLEAHVDPRIIFRTIVRSPRISQKILYYLDRTFPRAQLLRVKLCGKVFGFWRGYEGKIPKKFLSVPLTEVYRSSYSTLNFVH